MSRRVTITRDSMTSTVSPWNVALYEDDSYTESHGAETHAYAIAIADDWIHGGNGWA